MSTLRIGSARCDQRYIYCLSRTIYASIECPSNSILFLFFCFIRLTPVEQPLLNKVASSSRENSNTTTTGRSAPRWQQRSFPEYVRRQKWSSSSLHRPSLTKSCCKIYQMHHVRASPNQHTLPETRTVCVRNSDLRNLETSSLSWSWNTCQKTSSGVMSG